MTAVEKRIEELETMTATATGGDKSFAELLRQARKRAGTGRSASKTRITQQMLDHRLDGEFYRQMHGARERVKNLRLIKTTGF
jgi:hypothetical protein